MLWYSLEEPQLGASNKYHNVCFCGEIRYHVDTLFYLELCYVHRFCLDTVPAVIVLDKREYQLNIFLISPWKHAV